MLANSNGLPWGATVFLGNLILHPWRVRKTRSQPAGVFDTEGLRVTVAAPPLSAQIKLGYETFGLYPIVSLAFKIEQYAVVAERPLRQSFNL